jgi:hypothetical protein
MATTDEVLAEVRAERVRQDAKWGEQNHPSLDRALMERPGGCASSRMCEEYEIPDEERAKFLCNDSFRAGCGTFAHILVEEVSEAISAGVDSEAALREELVQVAAVAVGWIEAIDRRAKGGA